MIPFFVVVTPTAFIPCGNMNALVSTYGLSCENEEKLALFNEQVSVGELYIFHSGSK